MANNEKNRKSEAQERFEEADNAGLFAGNDADAREAKANALRDGDVEDTTGYNSGPVVNDSGNRARPGDATNDAAARRGDANVQDFAGDAQNVNADNNRPLEGDELEHARNKANESKGLEDSRG
jgi:hypothetical protein